MLTILKNLLKQPRLLLPFLMEQATGAVRYIPPTTYEDKDGKIQSIWSDRSWTHNVFRVYEQVFGRRHGARPEALTRAYVDEDGRFIVLREFYTAESFIAFGEGLIRSMFSMPRWIEIRQQMEYFRLQPQPLIVAMSVLGFMFKLDSHLHGALLPVIGAAASYDTSTHNSSATNLTTFSFSHTCSGSGLELIGAIHIVVAALDITGRSTSYNSVSMTEEKFKVDSGNINVAMSSLANPATGSNTFTASWTNIAIAAGGCISISGTTGAVGTAVSGGNGANNTSTVSLTVASDTTHIVVAIWQQYQQTSGYGYSAGSTSGYEFTMSSGIAALKYAIGATSSTMTFTQSSNSRRIGCMIDVKAPAVISITKSLLYTVTATPSPKTKSLVYDVKTTPSAKTKTLLYDVLTTPSPKTKSLRYLTKTTPSAKTKSMLYSVVVPTAQTKSLLYKVVAPVTLQKSLKYCVVAPVTAIAKTMRYAIKTVPAPKTKSLRYYVSPATDITRTLMYKVIAPVTKEKSLKYTAKTHSALHKTLTYFVDVLDDPYSISSDLYTPQ